MFEKKKGGEWARKTWESHLWASWTNSSSDSSSSWLTLTSGTTGVSTTAPVVTVFPFIMSSCRQRTRCKLSFSANPWNKSSSSLKKQNPSSATLYLIAGKAAEDTNRFSRSIIHKQHDTFLVRTALINKVYNHFLLHSLPRSQTVRTNH